MLGECVWFCWDRRALAVLGKYCGEWRVYGWNHVGHSCATEAWLFWFLWFLKMTTWQCVLTSTLTLTPTSLLVLQPLVFSPCPELPTRVLIFRVFLRGLALLDVPVTFKRELGSELRIEFTERVWDFAQVIPYQRFICCPMDLQCPIIIIIIKRYSGINPIPPTVKKETKAKEKY